MEDKADIMGWWQKSITVVATRNWNKVGSSFPSHGTRTFMTFKSSHENKLLKSARQYEFVRYGYSFIWIGRYSTSLSSGHKNAYFCFWVCVMLYAPYRWNKFVLKRWKKWTSAIKTHTMQCNTRVLLKEKREREAKAKWH